MIQIYRDYETLSLAAANLFLEKARRNVDQFGRFSVVLSGGSTPKRMFEILAQPSYIENLPWRDTHVFWGDERCVPNDDPRSNVLMARQRLLDHVPVPEENVHPLRCEKDPVGAASRYEAILKEFFMDRPPSFDLVWLGLGTNGHTASLFPNTPVLEEHTRWAAEVFIEDQEMWRVTLTLPVLNQAETVVFLVSGNEKGHILHQVLDDSPTPPHFPAQLVQPRSGNLLWMVDRAAAAELEQRAS
jgi:6-phosphogluconolactonase